MIASAGMAGAITRINKDPCWCADRPSPVMEVMERFEIGSSGHVSHWMDGQEKALSG